MKILETPDKSSTITNLNKNSREINLDEKANVQQENISTNITTNTKAKDTAALAKIGKNLSSVDERNRRNIEVEDKPKSKASLNLRSGREFVPRPSDAPPVKEFQLDFTLSSEFTFSLKVNPESNPYKLAEKILFQIEFANPDYFSSHNLQQKRVQSKSTVK